MTTRFDPTVIQQFADRLYSQARTLVVLYSVLGVLVGSIGAYAITRSERLAMIAGGLLGLLGFAIGQARTFSLRLQAQTALCQVQIEANTRRASQAGTQTPHQLQSLNRPEGVPG